MADSNEEQNSDFETSDLVRQVRRDLKDAQRHVAKWRQRARTDDDFMAGYQWNSADEAALNEQDRPTAVFNFAQKYIRIVSGTEKSNRQEIVFVARSPETQQLNALGELASSVYSAVIDGCNGPEERSQAFDDLLRRGMGWTNVRLDTTDDPAGNIVLERIDGLKMHWDPSARKQNLEDARWVACEEEIPLKEAIERWPDSEKELRMAEFLSENAQDDEAEEVHHATPIEYQEVNETPGASLTTRKGFVRVIEYQYFELATEYRVANLETKQVETLDEEEFAALKRRLTPLGVQFVSSAKAKIDPEASSVVPYIKYKHRQFKRCFVAGSIELEVGDLPVQAVGFTYKCMTGDWDSKDKIYQGLLRTLKDPQVFANKFFSQTLHIINSNAKGGLMAEATAFADPAKAEAEWANPAALILLEDGALSGPKPRIQERSRPQMPAGTFQMLQWCVESLGGVSGINPELLGSTTGDVPGVAQRQRQIQGMTINAGYFSALTRYLRNEARLVFEFIREYVADGRLVTIGGAYNAQAIPLMREHLPVDYDLVIDEPTKSPNAKEVFWEKMGPLLPMLVQNGAFVPDILDYSPLPASIGAKIKQQLEQGMQMRQRQPQMPRGTRSMDEVQAGIRAKDAQSQLAIARAQALAQEGQVKVSQAAIGGVVAAQDIQQRRQRHKLSMIDTLSNLLTRHGRAPSPGPSQLQQNNALAAPGYPSLGATPNG